MVVRRRRKGHGGSSSSSSSSSSSRRRSCSREPMRWLRWDRPPFVSAAPAVLLFVLLCESAAAVDLDGERRGRELGSGGVLAVRESLSLRRTADDQGRPLQHASVAPLVGQVRPAALLTPLLPALGRG